MAKFKSGMKDEQFDESKQYESDDSGDIKKGPKITETKYTAGEFSKAHKIMSAVAKASQKQSSGISKNKVSDKKISKPTSKKQKSDFKKSSKKSIPVEEPTEE